MSSSKHSSASPNKEGESEESSKHDKKKNTRRQAVAAETYNPETDNTEVVKHPKSPEQRKALESHLQNVILLHELEKEQWDFILDAFFLKTVKNGEFIIRQGDEGDFFYVIESGNYQAFTENNGKKTVFRKYEGSGSFGELALLYSMPRAASVQATSDGTIWALDRNTFRRIIAKASYRKRKMYDQLIKNVKILSHLNEFERMNLADALITKNFTDGQTIMNEGDAADGMYFVVSGTVKIHKTVDGKTVDLKNIDKGGYFGELALLTKGNRAATAVASGNVKTAFLDANAFTRLLGPCQDEMKKNIAKYNIKDVST